MPAKKRSDDTPEIQSRRFVEAAEKAEVDQSGKLFERAMRKIVPKKRTPKKRPSRNVVRSDQ